MKMALNKAWTKWLTKAAVLAATSLAAATANAGNGNHGGNHSGGGSGSGRSMSRSLAMSQSSSTSKYQKSTGSSQSINHFKSNNFSSNNFTAKSSTTDKFRLQNGSSLNNLSNNNSNNSKRDLQKRKSSDLPIIGLNNTTHNSVSVKKTKKFDATINPIHGNGQQIVKHPVKVIPIDPGIGNGVGGKPIPIDPGIGNGKPPLVDNHNGNHNGNHQSHSNWNNYYCYPGNKYNNLYLLGWPYYGCLPPVVVTPGVLRPTLITPVQRTTNFVTFVSRTATPAPLVNGTDLQLVDVRMLDGGRPDEQIGPRYRVSFRNVGSKPVDHEFNVSLVAATEMKVSEDLPQTISRVGALRTNEVNYVDLRLPATVFQMSTTEGKTEFSKLLVFVDSYQETKDVDRENNMAALERTSIQTAE